MKIKKSIYPYKIILLYKRTNDRVNDEVREWVSEWVGSNEVKTNKIGLILNPYEE